MPLPVIGADDLNARARSPLERLVEGQRRRVAIEHDLGRRRAARSPSGGLKMLMFGIGTGIGIRPVTGSRMVMISIRFCRPSRLKLSDSTLVWASMLTLSAGCGTRNADVGTEVGDALARQRTGLDVEHVAVLRCARPRMCCRSVSVCVIHAVDRRLDREDERRDDDRNDAEKRVLARMQVHLRDVGHRRIGHA